MMLEMLLALIEEGKKLKNRVSVSYFNEVRYGTWRQAYLHFLGDAYGEEIATILVNVASDGSYVFDYGAAFEILEELLERSLQLEPAALPVLSRAQARELREKIFNS